MFQSLSKIWKTCKYYVLWCLYVTNKYNNMSGSRVCWFGVGDVLFEKMCRSAARRRQNCVDDVSKLLSFFTMCKKQNPQFFCDFQLDTDGNIVSIFWSHTSMQGEFVVLGMLSHLIWPIEQIYMINHWECLLGLTTIYSVLCLGYVVGWWDRGYIWVGF
jgi:hypothetical protein